MDLNIIKKLVKIVDSSEITDLEIEENGFKVKIAKKIRAAKLDNQPSVVLSQPSVPAELPAQKTAVEEKETPQETKSDNLHEIKSPIVGTFYRSPAPDADQYVSVGDSVTAGSVLCIVEAMKLMNEIESDVSGKIVKVLADNGKPVEYNQPLFLIDTAG